MDNTITIASNLKGRLIMTDLLKKKTNPEKTTKHPIQKVDHLSRWLVTGQLRFFLKYFFFVILFLTIFKTFWEEELCPQGRSQWNLKTLIFFFLNSVLFLSKVKILFKWLVLHWFFFLSFKEFLVNLKSANHKCNAVGSALYMSSMFELTCAFKHIM